MTRALLLALSLLAAAPVLARPPELRPAGETAVPSRLRQGESGQAQVQYADPDGDRPQEAWLVIEGGREPRRLRAELGRLGKEYRQGIPITWSLGPLPPGRYRVHFEAASIDGRARYPPAGESLPLVVESLLQKWVLLAAGVLFALAVLPGVVFVGARRAADPAGAARTSLAFGVLAAYLWFVWLFASLFALPVFLIVGIAAVVAFAMLARRRA